MTRFYIFIFNIFAFVPNFELISYRVAKINRDFSPKIFAYHSSVTYISWNWMSFGSCGRYCFENFNSTVGKYNSRSQKCMCYQIDNGSVHFNDWFSVNKKDFTAVFYKGMFNF